MVVNQPHFLLFTDASLSKSRACAIADQGFGRWHFVLERLDGPERLEAADSESDVHRDRLALLAVVRGLEALEQPSQVTLVTTSRYVSRGLRYGLNEWREAEYTWEHFGIQKPIRNADLWQRIDCAMSFHQVTCRLLQSPLVQAMVDTATEMDELTVLSNPIDAPFSVSENLNSENQTAAALARRNPTGGVAAGVIQRVDSAHGLVGTTGEIPATNIQPAAILQAAAEMVHNQHSPGRSPIVQPEQQLITRLPHGFRRAKISITLPMLQFHWMQVAEQWIRRWRERFVRCFARVYSRPTVAPT
jgi:ribonuclease HI